MATETLKTIIQPDIPRPDLTTDPFIGASMCEWLRLIAPQLPKPDKEIDVSQYILGFVLNHILNDDLSCFSLDVRIEMRQYPLDEASRSQQRLLRRLDWEISTPETPADIKNKLEEVRTLVAGQNWANQEEYVAASKNWHAVSKYVEEQLVPDSPLLNAINYWREKEEVILPHWQTYLYGKPLY